MNAEEKKRIAMIECYDMEKNSLDELGVTR